MISGSKTKFVAGPYLEHSTRSNQIMPHETISPPAQLAEKWPYRPRFKKVNGWRMHYIDEGEGDPILLLHGNPTWGYLWRKVIVPLIAAGHRVIVPDQIGFGYSEKPTSEYAHTLDGHSANLVALVRQLDLQRLTVVCQDWGGPTGLSLALHEAQRIHSLVVMSTWAWPRPPAAFHKSIFPWRMMHAPLVGPYVLGKYAGIVSRGTYLSTVDREKFKEEAQSVYEDALPDPASKLLSWVWPRWIPLSMIIWGREDEVFDAETFANRFKEILPHAEGPHLVTGRHFLQEDSGAEIGVLIRDFLAKHKPAGV
jgi:haloalkane dehalogenase